MSEFDRIQGDIGNAQGELLDAIKTFNELASDLIRSNEWVDGTASEIKDIRSDLQDVEVKIIKVNF